MKWNEETSKYFFKELEAAKKIEEAALNKIKLKNNVFLIDTCDDNKYDFATSDGAKYEVKHDRQSNKTNNFFIEYIQNNKLSGINTTEAHYYIIVCDGIFKLIRVSEIKNLLKNCVFKKVHICLTVPTSGFLIPCKLLNYEII